MLGRHVRTFVGCACAVALMLHGSASASAAPLKVLLEPQPVHVVGGLWEVSVPVRIIRTDGTCSRWDATLTPIDGATTREVDEDEVIAFHATEARSTRLSIRFALNSYAAVYVQASCTEVDGSAAASGDSTAVIYEPGPTPDLKAEPASWLAQADGPGVAAVAHDAGSIALVACASLLGRSPEAVARNGGLTGQQIARLLAPTCQSALAVAISAGGWRRAKLARDDITATLAVPLLSPPSGRVIGACTERRCRGISSAVRRYNQANLALAGALHELAISLASWRAASAQSHGDQAELESGAAKAFLIGIKRDVTAQRAAGRNLARAITASGLDHVRLPTPLARLFRSQPGRLRKLLRATGLGAAIEDDRLDTLAAFRHLGRPGAGKPVELVSVLKSRSRTLDLHALPPVSAAEVSALGTSIVQLAGERLDDPLRAVLLQVSGQCDATARRTTAADLVAAAKHLHASPGTPADKQRFLERVLSDAISSYSSGLASLPVGCAPPPAPHGPFSQFGGFGTGPGQLSSPSDVAVAPGAVYVVDTGNRRVQRFTLEGKFVNMIGSPAADTQAPAPGTFVTPTNVAVDAAGDRIYVCDFDADRVDVFTPAGALLFAFGTHGSDPGQFFHPAGIAVAPDGSVDIVDARNFRIQRFTADGVYLAQFGNGEGSGPGQMIAPRGLAVDKRGDVYVADRNVQRVLEFDPAGQPIAAWTGGGTPDLTFVQPYDVAICPSGNVWIADRYGYRLQELTPDGKFVRVETGFGSSNEEFSPVGVDCSPVSDLYVADQVGFAGDRILVFGGRRDPPPTG